MSSGSTAQLLAGCSWLLLSAVGAACRPVEGGSPEIAKVENHLGLEVGYAPEGCDPIGLDGDGRGTIVGAAFDCGEATGSRIERIEAGESPDESLYRQLRSVRAVSNGVMSRPVM